MSSCFVESMGRFDPSQLPQGALIRGWLTVPVGLDAPLRVPLIAARGARPGPTALLVAGVHGDEFEGIVALSGLMTSLGTEAMAGTVMALPVCNPLAFEAQSRATPAHIDGANLARAFPGDVTGTPTSRLAAALFTMATRLLGEDDLMVDLHSAGTRYRYLGLVGFRDIDSPVRHSSENAARHFGQREAFRLWAIAAERGMFNAETTYAGIPTVAAEAPGQGQCLKSDVAMYADGVANLLRFKGILPGPAPRPTTAHAARPLELVAGADGIFISEHNVGQHVSAAEPIGTIVDSFGQVRAEVLPPRAGQLWALRTFATVYAGEMVAWIV
jgi:predicted deacylase